MLSFKFVNLYTNYLIFQRKHSSQHYVYLLLISIERLTYLTMLYIHSEDLIFLCLIFLFEILAQNQIYPFMLSFQLTNFSFL